MARSRSTTATELIHAAPVFAALGDETRLRLVASLSSHGPQSIARLAQTEPITRQAVTKHLQALADAGLVQSQREGRERIWELRTKALHDAQRQLDRISAEWDAAVERLRAFVETEEP
jgi:DNA-binding transcriptional ArsR family regulator